MGLVEALGGPGQADEPVDGDQLGPPPGPGFAADACGGGEFPADAVVPGQVVDAEGDDGELPQAPGSLFANRRWRLNSGHGFPLDVKFFETARNSHGENLSLRLSRRSRVVTLNQTT